MPAGGEWNGRFSRFGPPFVFLVVVFPSVLPVPVHRHPVASARQDVNFVAFEAATRFHIAATIDVKPFQEFPRLLVVTNKSKVAGTTFPTTRRAR